MAIYILETSADGYELEDASGLLLLEEDDPIVPSTLSNSMTGMSGLSSGGIIDVR